MGSLEPGTAPYVLASSLRKSVLHRCEEFLKDCDMAAVYLQVSSLLSPNYVEMSHMQFLSPYKRSNFDAFVTVASIAQALRESPSCAAVET